ncbi:MAG: DNA primase [Burkholderiaceae bacterium]|nr:DNA primase [Burkholderiaceae bacterium]
MIPQQFIDELLRRVDVVDVVGQYVQLKRAGANYSGLCPFHTEKSPSFTVSSAKQFYHCFGCGAHGTALGFLIEHLGLPFPQAVEDLARRVGLEVPQQAPVVDPETRKKETDLRARLKDCLLEAAKFYQRRLKDSPHAVEYLKGRGLSGEIAARYHLGYAPQGWQPLQSVFPEYQSKDLVDAGLVIEGEMDKRYDRFRDRIMFPILSGRGEVLGFGARTLGSDEPKYLNSPETPVFSKGYELYGVFEARPLIREARQVWVVEGYMDVVALAQHGLGHAVATLGTATTPQHLQQLLRLSDHVVFMFDGDAAGQRAAARALETAVPFASEKNRIDFVFLPQEHDPDSFVRERGPQALRDWVAQAKPLSAWLLDVACAGQQLEFAEGRAAAVAETQRLLKSMPAGPLRSQILREAARRFDSGDMLKDASQTVMPKQELKKRWNGPGRGQPTEPIRLPRPVIRPLAERMLQIVIRQPDWAWQIDDDVADYLDEPQAALLAWIREKASGQGANFAVLHEAALAEGRERGSETIKLFLKLARPDPALDDLAEAQPQQFREEFDLAIGRLRLRVLEDEATSLASRAAQEPQALAELQRIREKIRTLKSGGTG